MSMTKRAWRKAGAFTLALLLAGVARAATTNYYHVASAGSATPPFGTWGAAATSIQAGVDAASAAFVAGSVDCVVLVSNGTYTLTDPILITNGITLRSLNGRDATFINGNYPAYSNRCLEIRDSAALVTLDGFTLSNGYAFIKSAGGGLFVTNSPAAILNCAVLSNRVSYSAAGLGYGAGIGIISTNTILMSNCLVSANVLMNNAGVGGGAGLHWAGAPGLIVDCQFVNHGSSGNITGGGVVLSGGTPRLTMLRCLVQGNYSDRYTGGLNVGGFVTVENCLIDNNSSRSASGGLKIDSDGVIVTNCVISRNRTGAEGVGGASVTRGYMVNCQIVSNYTSGNGGGLFAERLVRNCLIAANRADGMGGGVLMSVNSGTTAPLVNCTVVRNDAGGGGGGINNLCPATNLFINVIVAHNEGVFVDDISGFRTNFINSCSPDLAPGINGNVTGDPRFIDPGYGAGNTAVLGDYRLAAGSPAIDSGVSNRVAAFDLDAATRPQDGDGNGVAAWDMGAYEAGAATGGIFRCGFGTASNIALDSLEAAFMAEVDGPDTNNLAYWWDFGDGTTSGWSYATRAVSQTYGLGFYTVTLNVSNGLGQTASYSRPDYIRVYPANVHVSTNGGSVPPFGSWETATTNLQQAIDLAATAVGFTKAVLVGSGVFEVGQELVVTNPIVLRGFSGNPADTIIRARYPATTNRCLTLNSALAVVEAVTLTNGNLGSQSGAGGYVTAGTIRNCLITGNRAIGGGTPQTGAGLYVLSGGRVLDSVIENNVSLTYDGGGLYCAGLASNCVIRWNQTVNTAYGNGAGLRIAGGGLADRCLIYGNSCSNVTGGGGGVAKGNSGVGVVRNSLITGNHARNAGGGVYLSLGTLDLQNCTIVGNSATNGGGLFMSLATHSITNCIAAFNRATRPGGTNDLSGSVALKAGYSCSPDLVQGVDGNTTANPLFVKKGADFGLDHQPGNYRLLSGSPCVDSGVSSAWMSAAVDVDGVPRLQGAGPNMGVFETVLRGTGSLIQIR